jgi:pyridinium-3,5-biscarboxylic acid mononucleotide synthase
MRKLLKKLKSGEITVYEAEKMLRTMQIVELEDFAKMDTGRKFRTGFPEAIFAEGKDDQEIVKIIMSCANSGRVMVTRLLNERYEAIKGDLTPLIDKGFKIEYNKKARILLVKNCEVEKIGKIGIITAGIYDLDVAEEAKIIAEEAGHLVISSYDLGITETHQIISEVHGMLENRVDVIIVVAGRESPLLSIVACLVDIPVVGVPTSNGYGVGKGGFTALFSMLQSYAPGTAVVNIDNGFGAAIFASTIIKFKQKS